MFFGVGGRWEAEEAQDLFLLVGEVWGEDLGGGAVVVEVPAGCGEVKRLRVVAAAEIAKATAADAAEDAAQEPTAHEDLPEGLGPGADRVERIRDAITDLEGLGDDAAPGSAANDPDASDTDTDANTDATLVPALVDAEDLPPAPAVVAPAGPGGMSRLARVQAAITDLEGVIEVDNAPLITKTRDWLARSEERLREREAMHVVSRQRYGADLPAKRRPGRPPLANNTKILRARQSVRSVTQRLPRARQRAEDRSTGERSRTERVILQRDMADPQARLMHTRAGFIVGYNAQVTASDDQLVLAVEATDHPNDPGQLIPQIVRLQTTVAYCRAATDRTDMDVGMVVVDNGYLSAENVAAPGFDRLIAPGRGTMKDNKWVGKKRPSGRCDLRHGWAHGRETRSGLWALRIGH